MNSQTVKMKLKKSTKHTHVYEAIEAETTLHGSAVVKSVYAEQSVLGVVPPKEITVTVAW